MTNKVSLCKTNIFKNLDGNTFMLPSGFGLFRGNLPNGICRPHFTLATPRGKEIKKSVVILLAYFQTQKKLILLSMTKKQRSKILPSIFKQDICKKNTDKYKGSG